MAAASIRSAAGTYPALRRFLRPLRLPAFKSVVTAVPMTIDPPLGVTYHSISLRFTVGGAPLSAALIKSEVSKIRFVFDGDPYVDASAQELSDLSDFWNARYGLVNITDGVLTINAARPWEQESTAQDGPAWGCATGLPGCIGTFQIEVTLAGGATCDAIEGFAEVSNPEPMGRHLTIRRTGGSRLAAGDETVFDWPKWGLDVGVYAVHVNKSAGTGNLITAVQLLVDQMEDVPRVKYGFLAGQFRRYGLTQQTNWMHLVFNKRGRPLDAMPMVMQDLRMVLECSGALGNYSVLIEGIEGTDQNPNGG